MGNAQSLNRTGGAIDSYVAELGGDVVYERSLGTARFLKTVKCRHKNGYLVIKIFVKPDPGLSLRSYHKRLKAEREALVDLSNVYGYQAFVETDKAGYIVRQWVASNLYDRISTRPFLSLIEKKWIAFQILHALRDARTRKIAHGDIKCENILVTSWNWVYVSDFASYKPTFLPLDDPSDFSYFFDTAGRRTCYLAPERFYAATEQPALGARKARLSSEAEGLGKRDGRVTEAMDAFGAGCVLAELFLEGAPLFTLSQLFRYRAGELSVDAQLAAIEDDSVRSLILQMIAREPAARPSFDVLLHTARGTVFPESFYAFLHNYVRGATELPVPPPFDLAPPVAPSPIATTKSAASAAPPADDVRGAPLPNDSDQRVERIWSEFESVEGHLALDPREDAEEEANVKIEFNGLVGGGQKGAQDVFPVEMHIPNRDSKLVPASSGRYAAAEDGPAVIILALICANIRTCQLPSSKCRALDIFLALCVYLTDEAKLDRMVPYIVDLLHDDAAIVRAAALRTLMQVLMLVSVITPFNASIFPEYIFPNISHLIRDPEELVRCVYAQCIAPLADTAVHYLEMGQALKAHGAFQRSPDEREYDEARFEVSYDASLQDLQNQVQDHLGALLMDNSSVVKRAVLHNISTLCVFLGRPKTNDVVLSHMITYLNDRDWLLRLAFFESIVDVAACAGGRSLEEYILPLMIQALSDVEESVVARVLGSLTSLCDLGLFQKIRIWELMSATLGFLYHPNVWIRQAAAAFISSAATHLPTSDVWCILYPSLRHFLNSDLHVVDERGLLSVLKPSVPRQIFDAAVQWAMKADNTVFWKAHKRTGAKAESAKESMIASRKGPAPTTRVSKSEEDEVQLAKLRQLGMTPSDEAKLMALRDYIMKLAGAISSFASRHVVEVDSDHLKSIGDVELQKLKLVPHTIFLKGRGDAGFRSPGGPYSRRVSELVGKSPVSGTPRSNSRLSQLDPTPNGAPFEDLRRRLATINGSASSLTNHPPLPRDRASSITSPNLATTLLVDSTLDIPELPPPFDRPGSPTESVLSNTNTNTSAIRAIHRMGAGGISGQKAAPALGSSRTNAVGLLEAAARMRSDGSPEPSGRTSPGSVAGTVRGQSRRGLPSLASGSVYDGQEPAISHLLEHLLLDTNRDLQHDFGPKVHEGPVRRRNAGRQSYVNREGGTRRAETTLIAHLNSHSDCVTGLAVSPDHLFFVSSSDDKTVKVWDTARLERNVTAKPRHTYGQHHACVKCVCMLEGVHCFASAADDGSLNIVRVHVNQSSALPKYTKLQVVREHHLARTGEYITCMTHYNTDAASNLIYCTTHSMISILDLRSMRVMQTMENARHHGPITCMCVDRKRAWLLVGTLTGVLTLWDLRFGLLLKSWKAGSAASKPARIHQCVVHPSKGRGKWVMVATETHRGEEPALLMEVWDIEKTELVETFVTRSGGERAVPEEEPAPTAGVDAEGSAAAAIAALVRGRQQTGELFIRRGASASSDTLPPPSGDVRAFVVGSEFGGQTLSNRGDPTELVQSVKSKTGRGFMISGSEDRYLRLWDLARVERTVVLSGPEPDVEQKPTYSTLTSPSGTASTHVEAWTTPPGGPQSNRPAQRLSLINQTQQTLLKAHQDSVTSLACIDSPFRGGIISGDRSGVIKVWRVEIAD